MTTIRRIYVLPLKAGLTPAKTADFVAAFGETGNYIPGVLDSFAAVDLHADTVVWEMTFPDEQTYTGPYMVHPYHIGTLDNYLLGDSPERRSYDFGASRYRIPDDARRLDSGVRRIILLNLPDGADTSALERLAADPALATSTFARDDLAWKSGKGLAWTHVWEQAFRGMSELEDYLRRPEGIASSSRDGYRTLGMSVTALRILTYPFSLAPPAVPSPLPPPAEPAAPVLYTMTARLDPADVDTFVDLLVRDYDPSLARHGGTLLHRWRTWEGAYRDAEVQSTWQLESFESFRDFRAATSSGADPAFNRFVLNGMALVRGGTRRFHRAIPPAAPTAPQSRT